MAVEKKNIFLSETRDTLPYVSSSKPFEHNYPVRTDPGAHASFITRKLNECRNQDLSQRQVAAIRYKTGTYLEFSGMENHDLYTKSLENLKKGIRLLNVRNDNGITKATVYVPAGQEAYFLEKVQAYADSVEEGAKPKNNTLVRSIEDVKLAILDSFWVGNRQDIPSDTSVWCEIWLRFEKDDLDAAEHDFVACCVEANIELNERRIVFPERLVRLAKANHGQLVQLISSCNYIAEMRRAPEPTSFFDELHGREQSEWVDELLSRTTYHPTNSTVCLLDTGVTDSHPLLSPAIKGENLQAVETAWGNNDHDSHGTAMAGVALFPHLKDTLISSDPQNIYHQIESVKILPPRGENPPDLYGAVTERAVALAEIANPTADRSICMAVTSSEYNTNDGSPTSWSAAVDSITSGADGGDEKRLFFISAGNVDPAELSHLSYPDINTVHGVENPGQSWNAITVGAFAKDIQIESEQFRGFTAVADKGQLSPYSTTSVTWKKKWPIKPEILLDGGNIATNGQDFTECPDLSLLTTSHRPLARPFSTLWGTSSATAQAAHMAAQIYAEYPGIWPETVRALMIHSARWTTQMEAQFRTDDLKTGGRRNLLRTCGYGVPDLDKAIQCMNNSVNLIMQGEIQPFEKTSNGPKMKEMHLHRLPWPSRVLQSLGEVEVEMRVTLSYFVEPGPGEKGWQDRYRYPSCGLRFDVINTDESVEDFKKRINVMMRGEDRKDKGEGSSGSSRWYLGSDNRDVGSIHSDFIRANAVDLCNANYIGVFPVIGWWRERSHLGKCNSKMRYSLVVSLSTPSTGIDLYTPIITQVQNVVPTDIPTP